MPPEQACAPFILRRTGQRPLRGEGWLWLRDAWCLDTAGAAITLGLYELRRGGFVLEMSCQPPRASHAPPWHAALALPCLEDVAACLEHSVPASVPGCISRPPGSAALHGAALRVCIDHALRGVFAQAAGRFLHSLACHIPVSGRFNPGAE